MIERNIQMRQRNATNTDWENLFPQTRAANVVAADGTTTVQSHILATDMAHGAVVSATASRIIVRDTAGRAQVANGVAAADIVTMNQLNTTNVLMWMGTD